MKCRHDHLCFNVSCLYADTSGSALQIISGDVPCSLNKILLSTNIFVKYHLLLKVASSHLIFKCSKFVFVWPASTGELMLLHVNAFIFISDHDFVTQRHSCSPQLQPVELEKEVKQRFAKVSKVSYSLLSLMINVPASQFHIYLPWGQRPFSVLIVS